MIRGPVASRDEDNAGGGGGVNASETAIRAPNGAWNVRDTK